jgi:hypothetical protein
LDREDRKFFVLKAFDGAIVQIDVRHLEVRRAGDPTLISGDRKAVVLGRYEHSARLDLTHRVISAAVSVWHFHRFGTEREPEYLMAEADAENRNSGASQLLHRSRRVVDRGGIARPIRQKNAVGLELEHFFSAGLRGDHRDSAIVLGEEP